MCAPSTVEAEAQEEEPLSKQDREAILFNLQANPAPPAPNAALIARRYEATVVELESQLTLARQRADAAAQERDALAKDVEIAAGECLVPIPRPGSDLSRVLIANSQLRRQRDAAEQDTTRLDWLATHPNDAPEPNGKNHRGELLWAMADGIRIGGTWREAIDAAALRASDPRGSA